ncbi:Protein BIC1 [Quillaja saponaria]|uniref:Protein BIC1 n=1 Tax=Quillaja saponaria TaxID=32244 RepID=A0AAD7PYK9_QUISA|nr:Protein BIC1 [Quillaja saponaria]
MKVPTTTHHTTMADHQYSPKHNNTHISTNSKPILESLDAHQDYNGDHVHEQQSPNPITSRKSHTHIAAMASTTTSSATDHQQCNNSNNKKELALLKMQERELGHVEKDQEAVPVDEHEEVSGRDRLKRHRVEVAGSVWVPDIWGQETLLKDWIDCSAFDASLVPNGIMSARAALVNEGRRSNSYSGRFRIENRC